MKNEKGVKHDFNSSSFVKQFKEFFVKIQFSLAVKLRRKENERYERKTYCFHNANTQN